ncbi:Fe3+ hydroxamate ABC transporter substrate-binding protein [Priestia megaterium]|uniref:Fe3+ hydroxamate ABC transporter substrate-binding protein n=1 Tax=Priestia megaterium TaxID=1404 RepID=UPI000EFA0308|nr:Fe3+ hydroxamate ABC transporter substrate-binding protein [Priestia megaterium]RMA94390.1 hypothetical protein DEU44_0524 [Priestia megaterium]
MFGIKERCSVCQKEIQPNEEVWMRMKYPSKRGMTEIKAFLHQEAQFVCMDCFEKNKKMSQMQVFSFQNIDILYLIV